MIFKFKLIIWIFIFLIGVFFPRISNKMKDFSSINMTSCCVCEDEITPENPIYTCCGCKMTVHQLCYGIEDGIENWKCSPCFLNQTSFVKCQLCLQKGGAMKQTQCSKWIHVICALFTSGVTIMNDETMEPIDISKISEKKRNKMCSICYSTQGFSSFCANKKCKNRLHVTCGQKHGTLKEDVSSENGSIQFLAYCKNHKPKESFRRVSSESIKNVVTRKNRNVRKNNQVNNENSDWILNRMNAQSTPISKQTLKRPSKLLIIFEFV